MRKRILWVTPEIPDLNGGGGSIRQHHLLSRLAREADVEVVMIGALPDAELRAQLVGLTELPHPPARSSFRRRLGNVQSLVPGQPPSEVEIFRPVAAALRRAMPDESKFDVVQIEHELLSELLPRTRVARWAITLHNLVSVRMRHQVEVTERRRVQWLLRSDTVHATRLERKVLRQYDLTITVSEEDAAAIGPGTAVVPNGVDLDRFRPTAVPGEPRVLFSGSFNYEPNIDGAQWLCEAVLPRVRAVIPNATVLLVGRDPNERVRKLASLPGVEAHFDVPSVVPFLESARVALVPLRMGSGTRLKALEAMAARRPLVGTAIGLEGIGLVAGESAAIENGPDSFADQIVSLCRDDARAESMAEAAYRLVVGRFGWDRIADEYVERVLSLAGSSPSTGHQVEPGLTT